MAEMLSTHISRAEFEQSAIARARGIDNALPDRLVAPARALCLRILEPIRAHFGLPVQINSGYRSQALNRAVGSTDSSQHRRGEAADIEIPLGPSNADLALWVEGSGLPFDQLILESYRSGDPRSGWVHVSHAFGRSPRRQALTMTLAPHGAAYTSGIHV